MTEQEPGRDADVVHLPPLIRPDAAVPVVVLEDGEWWPGFVKAWRGNRVSVAYTKALGMTHLSWVPADRVKRVEAFLQDIEE